ncbi:unnamed protein product [Hanseniaspora opuntiae]
MLSTGNDLINLFSTKSAKNGQPENMFSPPYMCSPMSLSSESVRNYNFNRNDLFDLSKTEMKGLSRETSPIYITQEMHDVNLMKQDTLKPFTQIGLNSSGTTVMGDYDSLDDILNYNFTKDSETLNQTPVNNEATSIAPSDLMNDAFDVQTQDLKSKSLSLVTAAEMQGNENIVKVKKVYNTRGKSISDSRLSTESLRQSFQLSSASAANKLEEYIEKLLVEHCNFQLGYRTWVRDTEKDEREEILKVLEFQLNKNLAYLNEITGIDKKLEKRSIETIVRKCTYAKQQSRLRKERRKAAQVKSKLAKEGL